MGSFNDSFALTDNVQLSLGTPTCPTNTRTTQERRIQMWFNNPVYYTKSDMDNSIQDGVDEIVAFTGCVYNSAVIPFSPNTTYYDMLTLLPDYIGVVSIFNSVIKRWLLPQTIRKFDQVRVDWETAAGVPYYFAPVNHRYVSIFKKPIAADYGNMYVFYIASAPLLGDDTAIPIPDDHIQALDSYNIKDLWEQNQEFTKAEAYFEKYTKDIETLRVYMKNKRNSDRVPSLKG
jgi:hypothetical protein